MSHADIAALAHFGILALPIMSITVAVIALGPRNGGQVQSLKPTKESSWDRGSAMMVLTEKAQSDMAWVTLEHGTPVDEGNTASRANDVEVAPANGNPQTGKCSTKANEQ